MPPLADPARAPTNALAPVPALGYVRVSTEDQAAGDRLSLAQQETAIREAATARGAELLQVFRDPGASGGTAERPGFQALVSWCETHRRPATALGLVLCYDDTRWGRFDDETERAAYWRVRLLDTGWRVQYVLNDDTADPMARSVMRAIFGASAAAYRTQVRQTAKRGTRASVAAGFWVTREPFGYRRRVVRPDGAWGPVLQHGERKPPDMRVKLVPGPDDEVAIVRWLFERYASGEVGLWVLAQEAWARWPHKRWSGVVVRAILLNRAYVGDLLWCRRPADARERRATPVRAREEWMEVRDAHEPLVSRALFAQVAAQLAKRQHSGKRGRSTYVLSGVLRCAACGEAYVGGGRGPGTKDIAERRYYLHRYAGGVPHLRPQHVRECPWQFTTLNQAYVERAVVRAVARQVDTAESRDAIAAAFDRIVGRERQAAAEQLAPARQDVRRLRAERERLATAVAEGAVPADAARVAFRRLDDELERAETAVSRARFSPRQVDALDAERARVLEDAASFTARATELRGPALRSVLLPWVEEAVVDRSAGQLRLGIRPVPHVELMGSAARGSR